MSDKSQQTDKDLMAINLESLVSEAKEKDSFHEGITDKQPPGEVITPGDKSSCSNFYSHIDSMKVRVKRDRKRAYYIDDNIIDVMQSCDFGKTSITNVINAALRAFIDDHKQQLREILKPSPKLIIEE